MKEGTAIVRDESQSASYQRVGGRGERKGTVWGQEGP